MNSINKNVTFPLFTLLFLIFSSVVLLENVAETMLVTKFSIQKIMPYMFLLNGLFLFIVSFVLFNFIDRLDRALL
ncbi:MAG: hypothetical protein ABIA63_09880, partial [bacterium]